MEVRVVSSGAEVGAPMEGQGPPDITRDFARCSTGPGGTEYSMPVVIAVIAKRFLRGGERGDEIKSKLYAAAPPDLSVSYAFSSL